MSDVGATADDNDEGAEERTAPTPPAAPAIPRRSFFDIYKSGQGYNTRVWSGVSIGAMVCWLAYFVFDKLSVVGAGPNTKLIQVSVAVAIILGLGLLAYWLLALNRRVGDFLIATEGEMKKVSWSTRKEIIGSTKVVLFSVIALGVILFVVDLFFMTFFSAIGILKAGSFLDTIKSLF